MLKTNTIPHAIFQNQTFFIFFISFLFFFTPLCFKKKIKKNEKGFESEVLQLLEKQVKFVIGLMVILE